MAVAITAAGQCMSTSTISVSLVGDTANENNASSMPAQCKPSADRLKNFIVTSS